MMRLRVALGILIALFSFRAVAADLAWTPASTNSSRSVQGVGGASDTFDTTSTTDGMALSRVGGFAVWVCADEGETVTTSFVLEALAFHPFLSIWTADAPEWDIPNAQGGTGERCQYMQAFKVFSPAGRVGYQPTAGAVSGGDITIWIVATTVTGDLS